MEVVLGIHEGTPIAPELAAMEDTLVIARAIVGSLDSSVLSSEDSIIGTVEEILHQLISDFHQPESSSSMDVDIEHLGKVFKIEYLDSVVSEKAYVILKYFIGCMTRIQGLNSSMVSLSVAFIYWSCFLGTRFAVEEFHRSHGDCNIVLLHPNSSWLHFE